MRIHGTGIIAIVTACCLCGCGNAVDGPPLHPVKGRVTLDGNPVEVGTITFGPLDAKQARPGTATIKQGNYVVEKGLAVGE